MIPLPIVDSNIKEVVIGGIEYTLFEVLYKNGTTMHKYWLKKNGVLYSKFYTIGDGIYQGAFEKYYPDGTTMLHIDYKMGIRHGREIFYHINGKKGIVKSWFEGVQHGMKTTYSDSGVPILSKYYDHGELIMVYNYDDNGALIKCTHYRNQVKVAEYHHKKGKLVEEVHYKKGSVHIRDYYSDEGLYKKEYFDNGVLVVTDYFGNDMLTARGHCENGVIDHLDYFDKLGNQFGCE